MVGSLPAATAVSPGAIVSPCVVSSDRVTPCHLERSMSPHVIPSDRLTSGHSGRSCHLVSSRAQRGIYGDQHRSLAALGMTQGELGLTQGSFGLTQGSFGLTQGASDAKARSGRCPAQAEAY